MLNVKDKGRLLQIVTYCKRVEEIVKSTNKKEFESDLGIREMICFNIFQIGELAKGLSDDFVRNYNKQPWKEIKGMRDIIAHGYGTIDLEIVWNTAKTNIKELYKYIETILNDSNNIVN